MEYIIKRNTKITEKYKELLLEADPSEEMVSDYINRGIMFELVIDREIKGVMVLLERSPQTVEIMNISVDESWQGRGMGKKLLKHGLAYAREQGYLKVTIATGNSSIGQLALYQKCGFRIVNIERDYFTMHYKTKIIENGICCLDRVNLEFVL